MKTIIRAYSACSPLKRGALYYFGYWGAMGMFMPFLNIYFQEELGFDGRQIGFLAIFFPLMRVIVAIPVSAAADRHQQRIRTLSAALAGFALLMLAAGRPRTFLVWAIFMPALAACFGPTISLADSIIERMAAHHALNFGAMRLWGSLSFAACAAICGGLWDWVGVARMFPVAGLALCAPALLAAGLEESRESSRPPAVSGGTFGLLMHDHGLLALILTSFLVGAAMMMVMAFEGLYILTLGGTQMMIGIMIGVSASSEFPTMRYRVAIIRRVGHPGSLLLGYALMGAAFCGYLVIRVPWLLFPLAIMKGLGLGLFHTGTVQLTAERAPRHLAATVQSVVAAGAFGFAPLISTPIGGELYDRVGPAAVFAFAALLTGTAALVLWLAIARGLLPNRAAAPARAA